jgi:hypothetical protein
MKSNSAKEDDDDDYNNDFEEDAGGDDQLEKLRRALDRENQKAVKHVQEKPAHPPVNSQKPNMNSGPPLLMHAPVIAPEGSTLGMVANLDSFAKAKGLVVMERVDHVAAN